MKPKDRRDHYNDMIAALTYELRQIEKQIAAAVNRKKQIWEEIDRLDNLMVEESRSGLLYREYEEE